MEQKTYQLCSRAFRIKAKTACCSPCSQGRLRRGKRAPNTYCLGKLSEGSSWAGCRTGNRAASALPRNCSAGGTLCQGALSVKYEAAWTAEAAALKMKAVYTLQEDALIYELLVENCGGRPLLLTDAGFSFPVIRISTGERMRGGKVIGHHFVSGHGSHLLFERCDGKGPLFGGAAPRRYAAGIFSGNTRLRGKRRGDGKKETAFTAYAHSTGVRREAEARATRPGFPARKNS